MGVTEVASSSPMSWLKRCLLPSPGSHTDSSMAGNKLVFFLNLVILIFNSAFSPSCYHFHILEYNEAIISMVYSIRFYVCAVSDDPCERGNTTVTISTDEARQDAQIIGYVLLMTGSGFILLCKYFYASHP